MVLRGKIRNSGVGIAAAGLAVSLLASCTQIKTPASEPYLSATAPPQVQELRWSNGKLPRSLDPARAGAAPESDIVCALYEGLTDLEPSTLNAIPAAAEKWTVSEDGKTWTFHLRKDAKWSNGKRVTAADFVTSWKRAASMGSKVAHPELLDNIVGLIPKIEPVKTGSEIKEPPAQKNSREPAAEVEKKEPSILHEPEKKAADERSTAEPLGVEAVDDATLRVTLVKPDSDFPKLVSDPLFRPIFGDGSSFDATPLDTSVVTNGPFAVAQVSESGVTVQRSETYWNKPGVKLERIRFVPTETAEAALDAYKKGELDAITNSDFEPLALKLLAPYGDFRQTTHNALNLYEFNIRNAPFSDRRVREALAVAIDKQKIVDSEFQGTAEAADDYLPITRVGDGSLDFDAAYARELLSRAGYPNGDGFPAVRLVINRNDVQQRVAKLVTKMWQQNLNVAAEIIVKEPSEVDAIRVSGEYDIIRRGIVLPSADESATLAAIFRPVEPEPGSLLGVLLPQVPLQIGKAGEPPTHGPSASEKTIHPGSQPAPVMTVTSAADALYELYSIPLYSPNAYSLVKPYVHGLQITGLNSVSVKNINIDNSWSAPRASQP